MTKPDPFEFDEVPVSFWSTVEPHTRWCLVGYYALAEIAGVRSIWFWVPSRMDLLINISTGICLSWWVFVDARRRGLPIPMLSKPLVFFFYGLVVPGYLIVSRGWRGLGWLIFHMLTAFFVMLIVMQVGGLLVYGSEWWRLQGLTNLPQ